MDDLLDEFLIETTESLEMVDVELVKFERNPRDRDILSHVFRLVHTIKGTCGFLGLDRLGAIAHAAETLLGRYRDGQEVTQDGVTLILTSIDRIKGILDTLSSEKVEPEGNDNDLIAPLEAMSAEEPSETQNPSADQPDPLSPDDLTEQVLSSSDARSACVDDQEKPGLAGAPPSPVPPSSDAPGNDDREIPDQERDSREPLTPVNAPEDAPTALLDQRQSVADRRKPAVDLADVDSNEQGSASTAPVFIRVNVETLDHLMAMVSELVLTRNQLLEIARNLPDSSVKGPLQRLSKVTVELQEGVMKTRMQPIANAWRKLPRIVRDLSQSLNKEIDLIMVGDETELDRQIIELIGDPLIHMVRNSCDHGLEVPAERIAAGKSETGTLRLSASHVGGYTHLEISDDGKGIDVKQIGDKAVSKGLISAEDLAERTDSQILNYVFHPGFSTAKAVTKTSGRGVGMDVVRTNIEKIGGSVELKSKLGEGTHFLIKIPLTLAIDSALIVEIRGERYAVPQNSVLELVRAAANSDHRIEYIHTTPVLRLRDALLPLIDMDSLLEPGQSQPAEADLEQSFVVVIQAGSYTFGIVVDGVFHTEEIVIKPMASRLKQIPYFSGTTILGDGSVILILDVDGIAQQLHESSAIHDAQTEEENRSGASAETRPSQTFLLFRAGEGPLRAAPLSLITRLEEIDIEEIEDSSGTHLIQYRGRLVPLTFTSSSQQLVTTGRQPILILSDNDFTMGLIADEIIDIVEASSNVEISTNRPGSLGSTVIKERATDVIDVGYYLGQSSGLAFERPDQQPSSAQGRLLLVDDSAFFRNLLTPILQTAGYEVTTCASAVLALELLQNSSSFDIIVSDTDMPEMDGSTFSRTLRERPYASDTPIIALSSDPSSSDRIAEEDSEFVSTVAKFDRPGLLEAVSLYRKQAGAAA